MTGHEVSNEEIQNAADFLTLIAVNGKKVCADDDTKIVVRMSDMVRSVAWYGSLRAKGIQPSSLKKKRKSI